MKWDRLAKNPVDAADPPRVAVDADDMQTWTVEELRQFLTFAADSGDRNHAMWVLLATTGMRRGEALGLRWKDVDLEAGRLRVVQTVLSINGKIAVSEPKTARGRRPIALDPATVAVLREHRRKMLEERMLVGPDHSDAGLVFHRPDGSALRPETVSTNFLRRQRRLDLPRLTLKGLRHTWATLALEQGVHPKVVQERLGHSHISITIGRPVFAETRAACEAGTVARSTLIPGRAGERHSVRSCCRPTDYAVASSRRERSRACSRVFTCPLVARSHRAAFARSASRSCRSAADSSWLLSP